MNKNGMMSLERSIDLVSSLLASFLGADNLIFVFPSSDTITSYFEFSICESSLSTDDLE